MCIGSLNFCVRMSELFLRPSHYCVRCGKSFLAHEDGCPNCGPTARTKLLSRKSQGEEDRPQKARYWFLYNDFTKEVEQVFPGDSSPWPNSSEE